MDYNIYKEAAKAVGFYDSPLWNPNNSKPVYFDLFIWSKWNSGNELFAGSLNEYFFDTEEKKIYYLKGILEDSGLRANKIFFANSNNKVERTKKWIGDLSYKYLLYEVLGHGIIKHTIEYSIPICHTIELHPKVIEFIQNYK